jgi:DNA-binding MarR family transcriptional regulator
MHGQRASTGAAITTGRPAAEEHHVADASGGPGGQSWDLIDEVVASWAVLRPDLKTAPVAVVMRINRLSAHFRAEMDAVFAEFRLTGPAFELLATLRRSGPPYRLSHRQIAEILGLAEGTVSLRVKHMVGQGLVHVEPDTADRRVSFVHLTGRGLQVFDKAAPAHLAGEEDLVRALSGEEQRELARLLRTLLLSFEGSPASLTPARAAGLRVMRRSASRRPRRSGPAVGVTVTAVTAGSTAARAGIRRGDVITAVSGHPVRSPGSLNRAISLAQHAGQAAIEIRRDGTRHQITLTGLSP